MNEIARSIADLTRTVEALRKQVAEHETKLRWVTMAALLVIGAVGGPNAVQLVTTGTAG